MNDNKSDPRVLLNDTLTIRLSEAEKAALLALRSRHVNVSSLIRETLRQIVAKHAGK